MGQIEIVEFSARAVHEFFGFLYTGQVKDSNKAMKLFTLATKFDIVDLIRITEDLIIDNLETSNSLA